MLIGELAAVSGTTAKTIRFYEANALLPEPRVLPTATETSPRRASPAWTSSAAGAPPVSPWRRSARSSGSETPAMSRASTSRACSRRGWPA